MQKITDKIAALPPGEYFHSLEFFPPKTEMGFQNLNSRLERMALALRPLFVTVTWGAGGSTSAKSLQLAETCQRHLNLTTCLHLTCTNMPRKTLDDALESAKRIGIRNILALRGDPSRNEEYFNPTSEDTGAADGKELAFAVDLVKYIREKYDNYFCIGVAGYPEGHAEGTVPEAQSTARDLPYLIEKVNAGADFIITQLFYDASKYIEYEQMLRNEPSGIFKEMVIIPGLMPIQSYHILRRTSKLSNAALPQDIIDKLEDIKGDDTKVKVAGVDIISDILSKIKSTPSTTPRGFHFYTLNLEKAVSFVLEKSDLIPPPDEHVIVYEEERAIPTGLRRTRRASSVTSNPQNHVIVDFKEGRRDSLLLETAQEAGLLKSQLHTEQLPEVTLAISEGEGSLGREATWDDFPNGRFGDARSPAFGEIDGYGPSLHMSPAQAAALWGYPVSTADISELFVKHITGSLSAIPWTEEGLNEETAVVKNELIRLNRKGWWTIASQPAVNGARSEDAPYGWGPKGGFVYQKAFVEFFIPPEDWERLEEQLKGMGDVISYYSGNASGEYRSNMPSSEEALNAVTWGCFKAKEIITPTIIEEVNFGAWKEEAFTIWKEWSRVYPPHSATANLIADIANRFWLVNVIHHEFPRPEALWETLGVAA